MTKQKPQYGVLRNYSVTKWYILDGISNSAPVVSTSTGTLVHRLQTSVHIISKHTQSRYEYGLLAHWTLVAIYTSYLFSVYAPKILDRRQLGTPAGKIGVHKPASYCLHISQRAPPKHIPAPGQNPSKIFPRACQTPLNSWNFDFFEFRGGGGSCPRKTMVGDLCHALSSILGGLWAL